MAIYSFKMENISRGEGQSSVNSAAYRHRKVFFDNRTGETCSSGIAKGGSSCPNDGLIGSIKLHH